MIRTGVRCEAADMKEHCENSGRKTGKTKRRSEALTEDSNMGPSSANGSQMRVLTTSCRRNSSSHCCRAWMSTCRHRRQHARPSSAARGGGTGERSLNQLGWAGGGGLLGFRLPSSADIGGLMRVSGYDASEKGLPPPGHLCPDDGEGVGEQRALDLPAVGLVQRAARAQVGRCVDLDKPGLQRCPKFNVSRARGREEEEAAAFNLSPEECLHPRARSSWTGRGGGGRC
eukprot:767586-Hanusia_phi.AAC.1